MKYLKTYQIFESHMDNFLYDLAKELKPIGFDLEVQYPYLSFLKLGETFLDYNMDDFSIDKLKEDCINSLEEDKSDWTCDDTTKDDYDVLCTAMLVFIDEWKNNK